jgi:hypothetical protein
VLAYVRKLARELVAKRRWLIALTRDYVDVLETELAAETAWRRIGWRSPAAYL